MSNNKMEAIEAIIELIRGNDKEKKESVPRETEGFKSLVSKEEFEALEVALEAWDKFIDIHNKSVIGYILENPNATPYAMVQYNAFCEYLEKGKEAFAFMHNIHKFDKQTMDELCEETDVTIEQMEEATRLSLIDAKD